MALNEPAEHPELSKSLRAMSGLLLSEESLDAILNVLIDLARESITGVDDASISLSKSGGFQTSHFSSAEVREADSVQYRSGKGPCLQATETATVVNVALAEEQARWPEFTAKATSQGYFRVLSVPLVAGQRSMGALNLYSRQTEQFRAEEISTAEMFAGQASVVLANAIAFAAAGLVQAQLEEALMTRDLIGQAKGVLMARQECDADEAFGILRRASQRTNRKLRDVAREIVDAAVSGEAAKG